jgi:hypothetical protein
MKYLSLIAFGFFISLTSQAAGPAGSSVNMATHCDTCHAEISWQETKSGPPQKVVTCDSGYHQGDSGCVVDGTAGEAKKATE